MKIGIIGCGINGSYLAFKLAKKYDVTVFEKNKKIGKKPCSCLVSKRIWDFIPKNKKIIENVIEEAVIHFPNKKIKLIFNPKLFVLNRRKLDKYVAKLAKKNRASILLNKKVDKIYFLKGHKPSIHVSKKIFEFDYLIGCDGFDSIVRKTIGIPDPEYKLGIYTYKRKKDKSNRVDVFPTKNGFAWKIPRGSRTEYGILEKLNKAKKLFRKFCKSKRIKPKRVYSHIIPFGLVKARKERIALCGDAIGLTKPLSGGGIIWGFIACNILFKNFPNFKKYNYKLLEYFEPKILFSKIGNRFVRFFGDKVPWVLPEEVSFDSDLIY